MNLLSLNIMEDIKEETNKIIEDLVMAELNLLVQNLDLEDIGDTIGEH